jgi:pyruvate formate-lyase activating enzyme-like uncharacterized protein
MQRRGHLGFSIIIQGGPWGNVNIWGGRGICTCPNPNIIRDRNTSLYSSQTSRITGFLDFLHRPVILGVETRLSETGSVSVLWWRGEDTYSVGPLRKSSSVQCTVQWSARTWRVARLYSEQYSEMSGHGVLFVCRVKCEDMACCSSVECTVQWSVKTWRVARVYSVQYSEVTGHGVLLVCTRCTVKCEDMTCCSSVQCTVQWSVRTWRVARLCSVQYSEMSGHGVLLVCTVYSTVKCEDMACCSSVQCTVQWNSSILETVRNWTHVHIRFT